MRVLGITAAVFAATLALAAPAGATSCVLTPPIERFEAAPAAATATLLSTREVGPPPTPGSPTYAGAPTGPVVEFLYRLRRVYKGAEEGLESGDLVFSEYRVNGLPAPGGVHGLLYRRVDGRLVPEELGICNSGLSPLVLRRAALLNRYGAGRSAAAHGCNTRGTSCQSIKRDGRDAILRYASFRRRVFYRLCVTPPAGGRTCARFQLRPDREGLHVSRVRWSAHFPDYGPGVYRVEWPDDPLTRGALTFRR